MWVWVGATAHVSQDSAGNEVTAALRPELSGQVLQAVVTPWLGDEQRRSDFVAIITHEGKFHFEDVAVMAVYGRQYRLNFTLPRLPNIPVCFCRSQFPSAPPITPEHSTHL